MESFACAKSDITVVLARPRFAIGSQQFSQGAIPAQPASHPTANLRDAGFSFWDSRTFGEARAVKHRPILRRQRAVRLTLKTIFHRGSDCRLSTPQGWLNAGYLTELYGQQEERKGWLAPGFLTSDSDQQGESPLETACVRFLSAYRAAIMSKQSSNLIVLTESLVRSGMKGGLGMKRCQASVLGLEWPLSKGWMERLVGTAVSEEEFAEFTGARELKAIKWRPKRRKKKKKRQNQILP